MRVLLLVLISTSFLIGQKKVLHYDETTGFNHNTRNVSFSFFKSLESKLDMEVTQDSDGSEFTMAKLMDYDLVIFSNTSGNSGLTSEQQEALEWFIDVKGGGLIGIHAASDTYRHSSANGNKTGDWDWYATTLGGSVQESPNHTSSSHVNVISEITSSQATSNLALPWQKEEEYYYWLNGYLNPDITEVLRVGDTGGNDYDDPRPVAWERITDQGSRIFYTSLGHKTENFSGPGFPQFRQLLEDATAWAMAANQTVPVSFIDFEVNVVEDRNNQVDLTWSTSSESNSDYFEVQRSKDGDLWETIGQVAAAGHSSQEVNYAFIDRASLQGRVYYRLKQVDYNGDFEYSATRVIEIQSVSIVTSYPNPLLDQTTFTFGKTVVKGKIQVLNMSGARVHQLNLENTDKIDVDLSQLPSGIYFAEIEFENMRHQLKLVKI